MSIFSNKLNILRKSKSLSMQALSDSANVSISMISKLERDQVQPTLDVALRLAEALGTTLSAMLEEDKRNPVFVLPYADQTQYIDPENHVVRRVLTPSFC